jgi:hypothetical protein
MTHRWNANVEVYLKRKERKFMFSKSVKFADLCELSNQSFCSLNLGAFETRRVTVRYSRRTLPYTLRFHLLLQVSTSLTD